VSPVAALGHDAGDRLLVAIAHAIREATPPEGGAVAARLGGDEFGILLPGTLAGRTGAIAEALQRSLSGAQGLPGRPRDRARKEVGRR
jgi:diguanylate cyclase (GGDEF)-like protein